MADIKLQRVEQPDDYFFSGYFDIAEPGGRTAEFSLFNIDFEKIKCKEKFLPCFLYDSCCYPDGDTNPDITDYYTKEHSEPVSLTSLPTTYTYSCVLLIESKTEEDDVITFNFICCIFKTSGVSNMYTPSIGIDTEVDIDFGWPIGKRKVKVKNRVITQKVYYTSRFSISVKCEELKEDPKVNVAPGNHNEETTHSEENPEILHKGDCAKKCWVSKKPH